MRNLLMFLLLLFVCINGWLINIPISDALLAENSIFEQLQNGLVLITMAVFVVCALYKGEENKHLQAALLALMSFSIFLREIEIQEYNLPDFVIMMGHGKGRTLLLLILWSAAIYYARPLFKSFFTTLKRAFSHLSAWFYLLGVLFLFAGMFYDKSVLAAPNGFSKVWMEEILEANGYLCMTISAVIFFCEQFGIACLGRKKHGLSRNSSSNDA